MLHTFNTRHMAMVSEVLGWMHLIMVNVLLIVQAFTWVFQSDPNFWWEHWPNHNIIWLCVQIQPVHMQWAYLSFPVYPGTMNISYCLLEYYNACFCPVYIGCNEYFLLIARVVCHAFLFTEWNNIIFVCKSTSEASLSKRICHICAVIVLDNRPVHI